MIERVRSVDIARGLALVSMYVAHVAPSGGPGKILDLSEFLTAPLFALLIGMGTTLAAARPLFVRGALLRAGLLVVCGLALTPLPAQIVIVLVHLGVLTALLIPLVRTPSWVLATVAAISAVVSPLLSDAVQVWGTVWPYRMLTMLTWGCLGLVLGRHLDAPRRAWLAVLGASTLLTGALLVAKRTVWDFRVYDGSLGDTATGAGLAVLVLAAAILAPWPRWLAEPLRLSGQMSLSLYILHTLILSAIALVRPSDDGWDALALLIITTWAFALAWHRFVPDARGPVEALPKLVPVG